MTFKVINAENTLHRFLTSLKVFNTEKGHHHCLKVFKGALSGLRYFLVTESPLKMMENAFYFTLKGLFPLKIFSFYLDFLAL